jgi:thiamine-phosphate pyrophosphorylase
MEPLSYTERLARLQAARLYLVVGAAPQAGPLDVVVAAALRGGTDLVQLRIKDAGDDEILRAAATVRSACTAADALFVLNDRPDLAAATGADGVHVGQDDVPIARARALAGPDVLIGVSTHQPSDLAAARADGADYAGVGPVHATPTKPGRSAAGLAYVAHAAAHAGELPWFAIGGIDLTNVAAVREAGATRIAVVRAIADATDPAAAYTAARALRAGILGEVPVGTT